MDGKVGLLLLANWATVALSGLQIGGFLQRYQIFPQPYHPRAPPSDGIVNDFGHIRYRPGLPSARMRSEGYGSCRVVSFPDPAPLRGIAFQIIFQQRARDRIVSCMHRTLIHLLYTPLLNVILFLTWPLNGFALCTLVLCHLHQI